MIIAIDGPSGSGKSSVARILAERLHFLCLDTGAMYRTVAYQVRKNNIDPADQAAVGLLAQDLIIDFDESHPSSRRVLCNGEDVTELIRSSDVDALVSQVACQAQVREALVLQQRRIGNAGNYVVEGRDIGTVVFPNAELKVFLTASAHARAERRFNQDKKAHRLTRSFEEILKNIEERDQLDSERSLAPLKPAEDAVFIDSTSFTLEEITEQIFDLARAAQNRLKEVCHA